MTDDRHHDGLTVRPVTREDLPAVADIYNHYVLHSTCTFAEAPEDAAYWQDWFTEHTGHHPAVVAVRDGKVVGWGTLSRWNSRCAYRHTVEDSVYVAPDAVGQGIGRAILGELVAGARRLGHWHVIAQYADHQRASEALHRAFGFQQVGCLRDVGFKFNRKIDVTIMQLTL
jgi:phosphinothricin acetyltransferase